MSRKYPHKKTFLKAITLKVELQLKIVPIATVQIPVTFSQIHI